MEQSKFILEVQSRQCLWNPNVEAYFNRFKKRQAWEEIAAKMFPDFGICSVNDKRKKVTELQKKWKSLRDYYKRRNLKEDIDEITKQKKPIVELLQFLDHFTKFDHDVIAQQEIAERTKKFKNPNLIFQLPDYKITVEKFNANTNHTTMPRNIRKKDYGCVKPSYEKNIHQKNEEIKFLQSLLPVMQSLNDRQRFEFKLEVMLLIKKIKYDTLEDNLNNADNLNIPKQQNILIDNGSSKFDTTSLSVPSVNLSDFKT